MSRKHKKHSNNSRSYTQINKGAKAPVKEKEQLFETAIPGLMMNRDQVNLLTYGALFTEIDTVHPFTVVLADFLFQYIVEATAEFSDEHGTLRDFCRGELSDVLGILLTGNDEYQVPAEWYGGDIEMAVQHAVQYLVKIRAVFVMSDKPNLITLIGRDNVDQIAYTEEEAGNRVILNVHFPDEFDAFIDSAYLVVLDGKAKEVARVLEETLQQCENAENVVFDNRYFCVKKMYDYLAGL